MADVRLLGLHISVYTRIARLALEEKSIAYRFDEVDIFADAGPPADYLALNPFGTIPCLLHDNLVLYETAAISRYVDENWPGPGLQPDTPIERARMNQAIGMLDSYCYRPMIWDVYVQRVAIPAGGGQPDEALVESALPGLRNVMAQIDQWRGDDGFLVAGSITLADLHFYPMLSYFIETPEGRAMLADFPGLGNWLETMDARPSARATPFHAVMD